MLHGRKLIYKPNENYWKLIPGFMTMQGNPSVNTGLA